MYMFGNEHAMCQHMVIRKVVNQLSDSWHNTLHRSPVCVGVIQAKFSETLLDSGDQVTK